MTAVHFSFSFSFLILSIHFTHVSGIRPIKCYLHFVDCLFILHQFQECTFLAHCFGLLNAFYTQRQFLANWLKGNLLDFSSHAKWNFLHCTRKGKQLIANRVSKKKKKMKKMMTKKQHTHQYDTNKQTSDFLAGSHLKTISIGLV